MTVHLDISQLMLDPRRSGIQRAERELIRHWPGPAALVPCHYDLESGGMLALPDEVFRILCEDAPAGGAEEEAAQLRHIARKTRSVQPRTLVNAELFSDPGRAAYYRRRPSSCRAYWLVYDFLPWLHPAWFSVGSAARLMPYLDTLCDIGDLAFISQRTRDDYASRIVRRPVQGPVIPMGADGLKLERQSFSSGRDTFVMLGTIEPRKNSAPVMEAFRKLWAQGVDAHLVMIGTASPDATNELALLAEMQGNPRFAHLENCSDEGVRAALRRARALIFPSKGEGFGIPPMEALHAGLPVIISSALPAISGEPAFGQIRLDEVSADTLAASIQHLMDDSHCKLLWDDAAQMPTFAWSDFAASMAAWIQR